MTEQVFRGLEDVLVSKEAVLAEVRKNRENHNKQYKEAVAAFRKRVLVEWREKLSKIEQGIDGDLTTLNQLVNWHPTIPLPQDHTKDYDRVLRMLEMSHDEYLE